MSARQAVSVILLACLLAGLVSACSASAANRTGIEQRQEVGVVEPRGDAHFAEEPLRAEGGRELRAQDLQGNGPVVLEVLGKPDRCHAAAPELTLGRGAAGEGRIETCDR